MIDCSYNAPNYEQIAKREARRLAKQGKIEPPSACPYGSREVDRSDFKNEGLKAEAAAGLKTADRLIGD
jgi:hypothetical protein